MGRKNSARRRLATPVYSDKPNTHYSRNCVFWEGFSSHFYTDDAFRTRIISRVSDPITPERWLCFA
jgi:hypothetical protein